MSTRPAGRGARNWPESVHFQVKGAKLDIPRKKKKTVPHEIPVGRNCSRSRAPSSSHHENGHKDGLEALLAQSLKADGKNLEVSLRASGFLEP